MNLPLLALLLLIPAASAVAVDIADINVQAATNNPEAEAAKIARQILLETNLDYRDTAISKLRKKGEYFDHARVEVTGFMSNDDTNKQDPAFADRQIKPSFSLKEYSGLGAGLFKYLRRHVAPGTAETILDASLDFSEVKAAMRGEVTARAKEKLADYKGKEINEIVAHSWGSELVYAAILKGELLPPKKLIVVGVPDDDREKWRILADRTGTEVHWIRSENDKIASKGAEIARKTTAEYGVSFSTLWAEACRDRPRTCHPHDRESKGVIWERIADNPGTAGHDRMEYYAMLKGKVIKGTPLQLRAAQDEKVAAGILAAEKDAFADALVEARLLVNRARDLAEIDRRHIEANLPKKNFWESADPDEFRRMLTELKSLPAPMRSGLVPPPPFSRSMPRLRDFAVAACRAPEEVAIELFLTPYYDHSYRDYDDALARELSSGLDVCSRALFYKIIGSLRANEWQQADRNWIRRTVAELSRLPESPASHTTPPAGGGNGGRQGGGGYSGGNRSGDDTSSTKAPPAARHDAEGEALEQLRETERRLRWGLRPVR